MDEKQKCTFKPAINKKPPTHQKAFSYVHESGEKPPLKQSFNRLYQNYKKKVDRKDRTSEEIEFDRSKQECRFMPKIKRNPVLKSNSQFVTSAEEKAFEKTIQRMQVARKEKEETQKLMKAGLTYSSKSFLNV